MSRPRMPACVLLVLPLASCGPGSGSAPIDLRPPVVLSVRPTGPAEICLEFDEEARVAPSTVRIEPALAVGGVSGPGTRVLVSTEPQSPGAATRWRPRRRTPGETAPRSSPSFTGSTAGCPAVS